jgi:hypothetical protein
MDAITGKLITAFVLIIVGIGLLAVVSDETYGVTSKATANQSLDLTNYFDLGAGVNAQGGQINETLASNISLTNQGATGRDCKMSGIVILNGTYDGALVLGTDYSYDLAEGTIGFYNTTDANLTGDSGSGSNTTYVYHTYCPSGYLTLGWGRTVTKTVPGFFALALLLIGVALFYSVYKGWGVK